MNGPRPGKCRDAWCFCPHGNYWDCLECGGDAAVEHRCVPFTPKRNAELEALREQVATLTAERDEAVGDARTLRMELDDARALCHGMGCGRCESCVRTAQAACVVKDAALDLARTGLDWYRAEFTDAESPVDDEARAAIDATLATDAGAPILALLDECAAVLAREQRRPAFPMTPEQRTNQQTDADLLTRLKARGPSRFVSVEKVREVAMKVAEAGRRLGVSPPMNGMTREELDDALTTIVDALLSEVTT